ncbi:MAG: creatininase family protein [Gemmatimonadota bacterium]|nr:creatininase family protein [Gemmatimonadota bacterium]MDH3367400.1 creatininase family protein [Gemmatimonadota bacterium]MDH3477753.1 creatininase family protein [Gemmatimonadota bacterium]MDH3570115.1 creatininase family protein [Gemmatimonadota bacterium]MDH5548523.1 creatininase family protein [Gemmatimonadota bacterium]
MPARPYILAETTWKTVREMEYDVAILPWGATEAHNYHLPYGTDNFESEHIAAEAARLAWEAGARVVVLPILPFGVQTGQLDIPFCLNLNPSTQAAVLGDLARSLEGHGVRKLVILNGHGGNDFRWAIRELQPQLKIFLCVTSWYQVVDAGGYFDDLGDHAGEMETSIMLHIAPALVRPLSEAGQGKERRFRIAAFRERWAWAPRQWTQVSTDTGIGDPGAASRQKGERYTAAVAERLSGFLVDLAAAAPDDLYEKKPMAQSGRYRHSLGDRGAGERSDATDRT